jgi:hypothetical protein
VTVQCADATPLHRTVVISESDDTVRVDFHLANPSTFTVWLTDPEGAPLKGIPVTISPTASSRDATIRSGADGRAEFEVLAGWIPCGVEVDVEDRDFMPIGVIHLTDDTHELRVTLKPAGLIAGHVIGPDDQPVIGIAVSLPEHMTTSIPSFTDRKGAFELKAPMGSAVDLVAFSDSPFRNADAPASKIPQRGSLRGVRAPKSDVIIRTSHDDQSQSLRVLVLDPDGHAVPGASVRATGRSAAAITDEAGMATLDQLRSKDVSVQASPAPESPWVASAPVKVSPAGQALTVYLRAAVELTGTILDVSGKPASGARIDITSDLRRVETLVADGEGRFRVKIAAGYAYDVSAWLQGPATGQYQEGRKSGVQGGDILIQLQNR